MVCFAADRVMNHGNPRRTRKPQGPMPMRAKGQPAALLPANASTANDLHGPMSVPATAPVAPAGGLAGGRPGSLSSATHFTVGVFRAKRLRPGAVMTPQEGRRRCARMGHPGNGRLHRRAHHRRHLGRTRVRPGASGRGGRVGGGPRASSHHGGDRSRQPSRPGTSTNVPAFRRRISASLSPSRIAGDGASQNNSPRFGALRCSRVALRRSTLANDQAERRTAGVRRNGARTGRRHRASARTGSCGRSR
jgi:hypothetical protein